MGQEANKCIVQDLIKACLSLEREAFCREAKLPLLVQLKGRRRVSFRAGSTTLSMDGKKPTPLVKDLVRAGNAQPVIFLAQRLPGPRGAVRLGRSDQNDIVIEDDTVSARHAVFNLEGKTETVAVRDLASTNGTWVNGNRLVAANPTVLFDGDHLAFGDAPFLFFYPGGLYDVLRANL